MVPELDKEISGEQLGTAVAVVNGVGFHTEVYCAVLWSLVQVRANVSAFVATDRTSGIEEVIKDWYPQPFQDFADFLPLACEFSAVLFVPVFPINTGTPEASSRSGFVLQGLLQEHRRNYTAIFEGIQRTPALMQGEGVVLTLIGHGDLLIPAPLQGKVVKRTSLNYKEYYSVIRGALAVLPAFASPIYLTHKASSSVAAAIISGTPLLADEALLRAYSYLPRHAVFEAVAGEHEASAMARVAAHSDEAEDKARALAALRDELYEANQRIMAELLCVPLTDSPSSPNC
ncbi:hypothetical protein WJX81_006780 [Elliptochloris bilobata]|uniref:Uncharacterized protein n=1 Tax=Elliptochloris bilobata TaxID=381761 RepID=A0AAW1RTH8_9CHLO